MSYKLDFSSGGAVIPLSALRKIREGASEKDIAALMLMIEHGLSQRPFADVKAEILRDGEISEDDLTLSCAFWNGAGVLLSSGRKEKEKTETPKAATDRRIETGKDAEITPSAKIIAWMDNSKKTQNFVKTCEDIYGDIFNQTELSVILTFYKEYTMKAESIFIILGYCRENGYSIAYAKKIFMRMVDGGIDSPAEVKNEIEFLQSHNSYTASVKQIFGIDRALSSKERPIVEKWQREYAFTREELQLAFDKGAAVNKASLSYCNKILISWREEGLKNAEEIRTRLAQKAEAGRNAGGKKNSSFITEDFFSTAVAHSYKKKDGES